MSRILAALAVSLAAIAFAPRDASALDLPAGFSTVQQVTGLDGPTALAYAPDGRLFIAEKSGQVRVVDAAGRLLPDPLIDISDHVNTELDRGLIGLAVDANFATNHFLYLLYTYEDNGLNPTGPKTSRLTRITVTSLNRPANPDAPETTVLGSVGNAPCPAPADDLDCIPSDSTSHSIGTVRADPDGTLWLGSGDASNWRGADPNALRTYDEHTFAGKIIHIDRNGRGLPGHPFCPAVTDLTKVCTKLYAKGFRNPFRFQLRPGAGPLVGDVGWETREEIDLTQPGKSYGWPCYEGSERAVGYQEMAACQAQYAPSVNLPPAYEYLQAPGDAAIVAGPHFQGAQYPAAYRGQWFFGDYAKGLLWHMTVDASGAVSGVQQFATGFEGGVDLELAPNGDLVYVNFGDAAGTGSVQRIVYGNRPPVAHASATPSQGTAPLTVNLSAAGSGDPDGEAVTYAWDFESDGSVDATTPAVSHTYASGAHTATLTVRDARGLAVSDTVQVLADESAPHATMLAPADGSLFTYGRPITLRGTGTDVQDGPLGPAALHWRITLHHGGHIHILEADRTGAEITVIPPVDHDADSYLELRLTARDSAGLEGSVVRKIYPETIGLHLESVPPGAALSYAGSEVTAPALLTTAVGYRPTVSAPASLQHGGRQYLFDRWSDGGARLHEIAIPDHDLTLTASYRDVTAASTLPGPPSGGSSAPGAAPRISLSAAAVRRSPRRLRGRVVGASGRIRVDVGLRLPRGHRGCRWWRKSLRRLSVAPASCSRTRWMRARVDSSGRWTLDLGRRPRRGTYVVLMRALTSARPKVIARATARVRIR